MIYSSKHFFLYFGLGLIFGLVTVMLLAPVAESGRAVYALFLCAWVAFGLFAVEWNALTDPTNTPDESRRDIAVSAAVAYVCGLIVLAGVLSPVVFIMG